MSPAVGIARRGPVSRSIGWVRTMRSACSRLAHWVGRADGSPPVAVVVLLAAVGLIMGIALFSMAASTGEPQPGLLAALAGWTTLPYVGAGLVAWHRRPASRLGPLMVAAGFGSGINFLIWSSNDLAFTVGLAAQMLPPVLFLHVFLAFPSGRLESAIDRVMVAVAYGFAGLTVPILALGVEGDRNLVSVVHAPGLAELLLQAQLLLVSASLLAGVVLLIHRRLRRPRPLRASLGYLVDSFAVALLMMAFLLTAGLFEWSPVIGPVRLATFAAVGVAPIVFLAGLFQVHMAKASVSELVVELGVNPNPAELTEAVSRALGDPSATLAFWLPEYGTHADAEGRQIDVSPSPGRSTIVIERDGSPVATLMYDERLADEPEFVASVAAATGMALHNAKLQVELRARLEELRGSRIRILEAEQQERRRLERDLHDGAQQRLVALSLELGNLEHSTDDEALRFRLREARSEVAASLNELRDLAQGIHPAVVSDHGLAVALESLATRASIPVEVDGVSVGRLPERVEMAAFFVVSESLTNIAKYARAGSAVVSLDRSGPQIVVEISDDGVGGADPERGSGLRGLADRVEALGGRFQVTSIEGSGTSVQAVIPCG